MLHLMYSCFDFVRLSFTTHEYINAHTWPERHFAAFDVFMCGKAQPDKVEAVIKQAYRPKKLTVESHYRGEIQNPVAISDRLKIREN